MRQRDFDQIAATLRVEVKFATPEEGAGLEAAIGALRQAWSKQNAALDKDRFDRVLAGEITEGIW